MATARRETVPGDLADCDATPALGTNYVQNSQSLDEKKTVYGAGDVGQPPRRGAAVSAGTVCPFNTPAVCNRREAVV